jgi:hypothetical protein
MLFCVCVAAYTLTCECSTRSRPRHTLAAAMAEHLPGDLVYFRRPQTPSTSAASLLRVEGTLSSVARRRHGRRRLSGGRATGQPEGDRVRRACTGPGGPLPEKPSRESIPAGPSTRLRRRGPGPAQRWWTHGPAAGAATRRVQDAAGRHRAPGPGPLQHTRRESPWRRAVRRRCVSEVRRLYLAAHASGAGSREAARRQRVHLEAHAAEIQRACVAGRDASEQPHTLRPEPSVRPVPSLGPVQACEALPDSQAAPCM